MPDFITPLFIGALLAGIGLRYDSHSVLVLTLVSAIFAFLTHMTGLPVAVRTGFWAIGLCFGALAVINAIYILM